MSRNVLLSKLKYDGDGFWEGKVVVPWWATKLEISIQVEEKQPSPEQIELLESIATYDKDLREEFIRKAFTYYKRNVYGTFAAYGENGEEIQDQLAPKLKQAAELWKLLETPKVVIPDQSIYRKPTFALLFECTWDAEHGFGVLYRNWKIVDIGQQGDVI